MFTYSWPDEHLPNRPVSLICVRLTDSKLREQIVVTEAPTTEEQRCLWWETRNNAHQ